LGLQNIIIAYKLNDVFVALGFLLLLVFMVFVCLRYVSFVIYGFYDLSNGFRVELIDERRLPDQIRELITVKPQELQTVDPEYIALVKSEIKRISTLFGIKYIPTPHQFNTVLISPKSKYHLVKIFFTSRKIVMAGLYVVSSHIDRLSKKIGDIKTIDLLQIFQPSSDERSHIPRVEFFESEKLPNKEAELLKPLYKNKLNIQGPLSLITSLEEFNLFKSSKYIVVRTVAAKNSENIFLMHQIMKFVLELIAPHLKKSS